MKGFVQFLMENMLATVTTVISAVAGILQIVDYLKSSKGDKKTPKDNKKKIIMFVIGVVFSISFIYLVFQYALMDKADVEGGVPAYAPENVVTESELPTESEVPTESEGTESTKPELPVPEPPVSEPPKVETLVTVSSVILDKTSLNMMSGTSEQIKATVLYSDNSTDSNVVWISSDEAIATVDSNGIVVAHSKGEVEIIVQASKENMSKEARCKISVSTKPTGYDISISTKRAFLYEVFYVYVTPYEENTEITIYGKAPSGEIYEMKRSAEDDYDIYAETGVWTIYAQIKNEFGVYEAFKPEDFVTIEIVDWEFMNP